MPNPPPPPNTRLTYQIKQSWQEVSPLGRIALGTILGFAIYYGTKFQVITPIQKSNTEIQEKIKQLNYPENPEMELILIRQNEAKERARMQNVKKELSSLQIASNSLSLEQTQNILGLLRGMLNKEGITLLKESEISPDQLRVGEPPVTTIAQQYPRGYQSPTTNTSNEARGLKLPENMQQVGYEIHICGGFSEIQNFLNQVYKMNAIFVLSKVEFLRRKGFIRNAQSRYVPCIEMRCELYIPYFKESK